MLPKLFPDKRLSSISQKSYLCDSLSDYIFDYLTVFNTGQSKVQPLMFDREFLVINSEQVKNRSIEVHDVNRVFNDVISKVSKRNIEALGKVNFSAKIDFSVEGGLKIAEIEHIDLRL